MERFLQVSELLLTFKLYPLVEFVFSLNLSSFDNLGTGL